MSCVRFPTFMSACVCPNEYLQLECLCSCVSEACLVLCMCVSVYVCVKGLTVISEAAKGDLATAIILLT